MKPDANTMHLNLAAFNLRNEIAKVRREADKKVAPMEAALAEIEGVLVRNRSASAIRHLTPDGSAPVAEKGSVVRIG